MDKRINRDAIDALYSRKNGIKNTLIYTLLLDYNSSEIEDNKEVIDQLLLKCGKICRQVFPNLSPSSSLHLLRFFGFANDSNRPAFLKKLDEYKVHDNTSDFFERALLFDAVITAYHNLVSFMCNDESVTSYMLVNKIEYEGFWKLYKKGYINVYNNRIKKYREETTNDSSKGSNLKKALEVRINNCKVTSRNLYKKDDNGKNTILLQYAPITYIFCERMKAHFEKYIWTPSKKQSTSWTDNFEEILNLMTVNELSGNTGKDFGRSVVFDGEAVDAVYHCYLMERILNCNLFFYALRGIQKIEDVTNYRLTDYDTFSAIAKMVHMPNVFSRHFFLKYAFDHIGYARSGRSFWDSLSDVDTFGSFVRKRDNFFSYYSWLEQFKKLICFFSDYLIPVYEGCFLSLLLDFVDKRHEDKYEGVSRAIQLLAEFIETHYVEIMDQGMSFGSDGRELSIIKYKNVRGLEPWLDKRDMTELRAIYYEQIKNVDLNMRDISPQYFRQQGSVFLDTQKNLFISVFSDPESYSR